MLAGRPVHWEWVVPRLPYVLVYQVDPVRGEIIIASIFPEARDRDER